MYNETPNQEEELLYDFLGTGAFLFFITFVTHYLFPQKVYIFYILIFFYLILLIYALIKEKRSRDRKKIEAFFGGKKCYKVRYRRRYSCFSKGCKVSCTACQDKTHPYRIKLRIDKAFMHTDGETNHIVTTKYISWSKFKKEMYRVR